MKLKETLQKLRDNNIDSKVSLEDKKNQWLNSINSLFDKIQNDWFADLQKSKLFTFQTVPRIIIEEQFGSYSINTLEIDYSEGKIILEPVGRNIVGGDGRIDFYLSGEYSKGFMLILNHENGKDFWTLIEKQYLSEMPNQRLDQKTMEKIIEKWIDNEN